MAAKYGGVNAFIALKSFQGLIRSSTFYSMIDASANFNKGDAQKKTAHIYSSAIGQKLNKG